MKPYTTYKRFTSTLNDGDAVACHDFLNSLNVQNLRDGIVCQAMAQVVQNQTTHLLQRDTMSVFWHDTQEGLDASVGRNVVTIFVPLTEIFQYFTPQYVRHVVHDYTVILHETNYFIHNVAILQGVAHFFESGYVPDQSPYHATQKPIVSTAIHARGCQPEVAKCRI